MAAVTHLLDTSALLAHYFDEPGGEAVNALWQQPEYKLGICVLTIPELKTRLLEEVGEPVEIERALDLYLNHLTTQVIVDRPVAELAAELRDSTPSRLPLVDACIAACAWRTDSLLVHRDPHMDPLPPHKVRQLRLPDRSAS